VFDSNGNESQHAIVNVPENEFITGASANFDINISASEINFGTGNYLSARLVQNNQPGVQWNSPPVPIVKSPIVTISPASVAIPCGSQTPVTFTMSHNMPSGHPITYNWSYTGWQLVSSTSNSRTLKPTTYPPSNVTVTPVYNGVNQPTQTAVVTLAPFNMAGGIQGSNAICSGTAVYTLGTGGGGGFGNTNNGNTVIWGISDPTVLSIVNQTNTSVTLMYQSDGDAVLTATITNPCNQTTQRTKALRAGAPEPIGLDGPTVVAPSHVVWYHVVNPSNNSNYSWAIPIDWQQGPGGGSSIWVKPLCVNCDGYITVNSSNDCGSETASLYVVSQHGGGGSPKSGTNSYKIHPNPAEDILNISFTNDLTEGAYDISAKVYNLRGEVVKSISFLEANSEVNVSDLEKGVYILKINFGEVVETHQIIIK